MQCPITRSPTPESLVDRGQVNAPLPTLTVASGASQGYFRCIDRFLRSAARYHLQHRHRFIAYDLGLSLDQRLALARFHPWCEWRDFDFSAYPPHVALASGHYAWKPIIIADLLDECSGQVLWLDSATLLHDDLNVVSATLGRFGTYTLAGQAAISERCDPMTLAALAASPEILDRQERVAGVVGFDATHPVALRIARAWRRHALIEAHIAPRSPRLPAHNPEQALLSILLLEAQLRGELALNPGEIDISSPRPVRWMSSRHKIPDTLPRWADFPVRLGYGIYKPLDRTNLRIQRTLVPCLDGLLRLPHDHYRLMVRRNGDAPVALTPPWHSYWADPFVLVHEGTVWVLVEDYQYLKSQGRLLALELDEDLRVRRQVEPLFFRYHVSFPFLLEQGDRLYMIPETHRGRCIDLYLCERFPDRWRRVARLRDDLDAADSVAFFHGDRWWLMTSLRENDTSERHLGVFWSFDLNANHWTAHPINALIHEPRTRPQPRAAGAVFRHGDTWLRPVQVNPNFYGESLAIMQIDQLDETTYLESPFHGDHPVATIARRYPAHHVSLHRDVLAWDVRDRIESTDLFRTSERCSGLPRPSTRSGFQP